VLELALCVQYVRDYEVWERSCVCDISAEMQWTTM
jgi:hypothetical protein